MTDAVLLRALTLQLKKGRDVPATLVCLRADGTRTWSKLHPFHPAHDLTHRAVESVLGFAQSFFGQIAAGAEIDALSAPGAPARMPREAVATECIVALFDLERANGQAMPAAEFNGMLAASIAGQRLPAVRPITEAELGRVRALRDDALARWQALPVGGTLELDFPAD